MQGSHNHIKFNSAAYFSTPVWTADASVFLKTMLKLYQLYISKNLDMITRRLFEDTDVYIDEDEEEFEEEVSLLRSDKKLGPLIRSIGPCSMRITKNPFQTLVEAIIYQQLSEASATAITKRFLKLYKKFPTPRQVNNTSDKKLKDIGLSGTKINYM